MSLVQRTWRLRAWILQLGCLHANPGQTLTSSPASVKFLSIYDANNHTRLTGSPRLPRVNMCRVLRTPPDTGPALHAGVITITFPSLSLPEHLLCMGLTQDWDFTVNPVQ